MKAKLLLSTMVATSFATSAMAADAWKFEGEGVLYTQTSDAWGAGDLFNHKSSVANAGARLKTENGNIGAGIGAGVELVGLATLNLEKHVVDGVVQGPAGDLSDNGATINQGYLTYGYGKTKAKLGRQELPMSLSPMAYSEQPSVFKNTFNSLLLVNTDIENTTLAAAYIGKANNTADLGTFDNLNPIGKDAYMVAASNTSIKNTTLTGTFYSLPSKTTDVKDINTLWLDGQFGVSGGYSAGLQAATISKVVSGGKDTVLVGGKFGGSFNKGAITAGLAITNVNGGDVATGNLGGGLDANGYAAGTSALYTDMIANSHVITKDSTTIVANAGMALGGGNAGLAVGYSMNGDNNVNIDSKGKGADFTEVDLTYSKDIGKVNLLGAYVFQDNSKDTNNILRFVARYKF